MFINILPLSPMAWISILAAAFFVNALFIFKEIADGGYNFCCSKWLNNIITKKKKNYRYY